MSVGVAIIGGGRIGAGNVGLAGQLPLSHLAAVLAAAPEGVHLAGIVEPDADRRAAIAAAWPDLSRALLHADIATMPAQTNCIAAITVPEASRFPVIEAALAAGMRGLIVEKPPARDRAELRRIADGATAAGVPLLFNYNRRFDPRIGALMHGLPRNPRGVAVTYARGLRNYASHFIDLLVHWFGRPQRAKWLHDAQADPEDAADPNPTFTLDFTGLQAIFHGYAGLDYDLLDMDISGVESRLTLRAGGAEILHHSPVLGLHYRGYSHLADTQRDVGPVGGFVEMYRLLGRGGMAALFERGCSLEQADMTMATIEAVLLSRQNGGSIVTLN